MTHRGSNGWFARGLTWLTGSKASPAPVPAPTLSHRSPLDDMRALAPDRVRYFLAALADDVHQSERGLQASPLTAAAATGCAHGLKNVCLSLGLVDDSERAQAIYAAINAGEAPATHATQLRSLAARALAIIGRQPEMR
jgi:hypothetical protein